MLEVQADQLSDGELEIATALVGIGLLSVFGALDTLASVMQTSFQLLYEAVDRGDIRCIREVQREPWMVAMIKVPWTHLCTAGLS